jgi:hypothetical protein
MQDLQQLEEAWSESSNALWEAQKEEGRLARLFWIADEARKVAAWIALFYAFRGVIAERAVTKARKENERRLAAIQAAQAPDEVPSAEAS